MQQIKYTSSIGPDVVLDMNVPTRDRERSGVMQSLFITAHWRAGLVPGNWRAWLEEIRKVENRFGPGERLAHTCGRRLGSHVIGSQRRLPCVPPR
jgi:hypothetical protein